MTKFISNILYFVAILFLLNVALYVVGQNLYFKTYAKYKLDYKSYMLADSHGLPLDSFTEKYGVYNFSASSDSYLDMLRKIKFLIRNTKVDTIYLTVDDHTLSPYRESRDNRDRSVVYSTPEDFGSYYEYFKDRYLKQYISFFQPKTGSVLRNYLKSLIFKINKKEGSSWSDMTVKERAQMSEKRSAEQFPTQESSLILEQALLDIIKICEQNNIFLIGIKYPISFDYIQALGDHSYNPTFSMRKHGLEVLDYKQIFTKNNEYFDNQDHLNEKGGRLFTKLLLEHSL